MAQPHAPDRGAGAAEGLVDRPVATGGRDMQLSATDKKQPAFFPGRAAIDAYGNGGFRFAEMSHKGSLLCLPSGIYGWDVASLEELTVADFGQALRERDELSLLLLGAGREVCFPQADVMQVFAEARMGLEVMDTGAAARTYNVLLAEGRRVGAALIAVA